MNILILIAAILSGLAFLAHTFIGTYESWATQPTANDKKLQKHWLQLFSSWHLVSVDLFGLTLLTSFIWWNILPANKWLLLGIAIWTGLWGIGWLMSVWRVGGIRSILQLPQWLLVLLIGISCLGATIWE